ETLRDIALLRFRTALSRFSTAPRQYCDSNACLSWTDLSEDSREIIEALVHGAYRGRTRLGTRITEEALRLAARHESVAGPLETSFHANSDGAVHSEGVRMAGPNDTMQQISVEAIARFDSICISTDQVA